MANLQNKYDYKVLSTNVELIDSDLEVTLKEAHFFKDGKKVIQYITENKNQEKRYFLATKDPGNLTDEERYKILEYCLGSKFDKNEIVNYLDLFIHFEFIKEVGVFK